MRFFIFNADSTSPSKSLRSCSIVRICNSEVSTIFGLIMFDYPGTFNPLPRFRKPLGQAKVHINLRRARPVPGPIRHSGDYFQELLVRETFRFFLEPCAEFLERIIAKPGQLLMHSQKRRVHFPAIEVNQFLETRIAKQDANSRGGIIRNHPRLGVAQLTRNQLRQRVMPMAKPLHQRLRFRALFLLEESKSRNPQFPNNRRGKRPCRATSSPNGGEFQVHDAVSPYPIRTTYT